MGHEKGPHGFGVTEDHNGDTADGAGTEGLPEPRTSTSFPEIWYLDWAEGEGLCVCGYSKEL